MESFKEEHSDGKVFSMDIQKLKNYASKHKMKVALGTTMAAALIAGASAGTYAYFTSKATANTNLTLNKGTVALSDAKGDTWSYYGNKVDFSKIDFNATDYPGETMINPDLSSGSDTIDTTSSKLFTGNSFSQVVPGDTFAKTVKVTYKGTNNAEVAIKFVPGQSQNWIALANFYNLKVDYQINSGDKTVLVDNQSLNTEDVTKLTSKTGLKISQILKQEDVVQIHFYAQLKANDYNVQVANEIMNFASVKDAFEIHAQNKLYPKTSTVNE